MKRPSRTTLAATSLFLLVGLLPLLALPWLPQLATVSNFPLQPTGLFEQWVVIITAFGIKPAYMLIALGAAFALRRRTEPDLLALRSGLLLFFAGEAACSINYMLLGGENEFFEYLHDIGMVGGFSLIAYAALEGGDRRLIHLSAEKERCAALGLCQSCIKYSDTACSLRRLFSFGILGLLVLSFMPLCASLNPSAYSTCILSSSVHYSSTLASQLFELRYCPLVAAVLLSASWLSLQLRPRASLCVPKFLLAAALGPLGFSLLRLLFLKAFSDDLVWYTSWEEFTEFLSLAGIGYVLFIFRASLFKSPSSPKAQRPDSALPAP